MKLLLSVFSLCAFSLNASASSTQLELRPLLGSQWAKEHPGKLPYEKCVMTSYQGPMSYVGIGPLGLSASGTVDVEYLHCQSPKLGLEFSIPIRYEFDKFNWGPDLTLLSASFSNPKVTGLKGHTLGDFVGHYRGETGGFVPGVGPGGF